MLETQLYLECEGIKTIVILDSGAGISIATKSIWEKWGKPTVRSTRMNLQLADGSLENNRTVGEHNCEELWY